ncbi:hypothetical protein G7B40_027360 [Aetokthonos hydrillicola Thurmond2011]|uniref:Uncharacterized protein n=1 Tax=Aetokthonos hydrillicola Thurmond2011 TaxID=2712845 RepID=A0AAP5MAL8_9CYAN|nr:hypothetical protein [Aetokthonos hydrillicola]MDR9898250.1 hypothetical protein [Aetokthonos hydrillicola Thurmond2011]
MEILHVLYLLAIALTLLSVLVRQLQYLQYLWKKMFSPRSGEKIRGRVSRSYRIDPKNRQLQSRLISLLRGDTPTAKRLLKRQRELHPGKSDNWYLEKVIYDLERDRRHY